MVRALAFLALTALLTSPAAAACVNKYVHEKDGPRVRFTLLTGTMTYDEAKALGEAIASGDSDPVAWLSTEDDDVVARQYGQIRVLRPMPVACGDSPSGVVLEVEFATFTNPGAVVRIHFDDERVVDFAAQKN